MSMERSERTRKSVKQDSNDRNDTHSLYVAGGCLRRVEAHSELYADKGVQTIAQKRTVCVFSVNLQSKRDFHFPFMKSQI
jgi:hypothetical protein